MKIEKNSVYLLNKCENLQKSLDFFCGGDYKTPAKIRRVIFLLQIDFWDWELEELIFSFKNFHERSSAWGDNGIWKIFELFKKNNIELKQNILEEYNSWVDWRDYDINSKSYQTKIVIPPTENLNKTIEIFNSLLDLCQKELQSGNLIKYKKELLNKTGK